MAKILIVDDDEVLTKLFINKLSTSGHEVVYAADGQAAAKALSQKFDVIVLDVMIPKVDGMRLLAAAKNGVNKPTPVLIYTNLLSDDTRKTALTLGASEVLFKADFTPFTFIDKINKYIP